MSLAYEESRWVLCYYENHKPTFERFNNKDELMSFIEDAREKHGSISLNDFIVFPPKADLLKEEVAAYGVPKMFLS